MSQAASLAAPTPKPANVINIKQWRGANRQRVLMVDDEPALLDSLRRHLRRHFEIDCATSGAEALELIRAGGQYQVVMTDLRMPGMDGLSFLSHARQSLPDAVAILLTAHQDGEAAMEAINRLGVWRYLLKPCPAEQVTRVLHQALGHEQPAARCEIREHIDSLAAVREDLQYALRDGQFALDYQPITACKTDKVIACQARLIRHHPMMGTQDSPIVTRLAEQTGMMVLLADWMLDAVLADAATWPNDLPVALPLPAGLLLRPALVDHVLTLLDEHGLPPGRLNLQVAESQMFSHMAALRAPLAALRAHGVRITLSDFGAGYSPLADLEDLPIDDVKFSPEITRRAPNSEKASAILATLCILATRLGYRSIAPTHDPQMVQSLAKLGCTATINL